MSSFMAGLHPKTASKLEVMMAMLNGISFKYKIIEGYRTAKVQRAYWHQGRSDIATVNEYRKFAGLYLLTEAENKSAITNCDGDSTLSKHQSGRAVDIVPIVDGKIPWSVEKHRASWEQLGEIGKQAGFEWGGDWGKTASKLGWDCPHFEDKS